MNKQHMARWWFALTTLLAVTGVIIDIFVVAADTGSHFTTPAGRVLNLFFYFTIQSNVIVAATSFLLALRPGRVSALLATFHIIGVVGVVITCAVYQIMLAGLYELTWWSQVADTLLHILVPAVTVLGWLLFGPRGMASWTRGAIGLLFPIGFLAVTLIRGSLVQWYPYPFLDVLQFGYPRVVAHAGMVAVLFVAVTAAVVSLDKWLTSRSVR